MFKLQPEPTFWADVKVKTPTGEESFKMQFKYLDRIEYGEWLERVTKIDKKLTQKARVGKEVDLFMEVCNGWDIADTEFNRKALEQLVRNYISSGSGIVTAYTEGLIGAQIKN